MKRNLLTIGCAALALGSFAQIPLDYYAPLNGLTGRDLKQAVYEITSQNVKMLSYGSGSTKTWWGFYVTDMTDDGYVRDRYSAQNFSFGDRGTSVSGMNIEHSFPKSWWGGSENNAYKDLFNLMPCESSINNSKSNYPMANVDNVWKENGVTKVGTRSGDPTSQSYRYWEPGDQWKGDFARGYFYMATTYQDLTWSGDQSTRILNTEAYPTLQQWAYELYLQWLENDPVDEIESVRNNVVEKLQGNRNPFVDFPNLAEYIWGDSVGVAFNPLTAVKSQTFVGGGSINASDAQTIYENSFLGDQGNCTIETTSGTISVWSNNATYGWKASGSRGSETIYNYNTDATLWTPELDLTNGSAAWLTFDHAVKFATAPYSSLSLLVKVNGTSSPLYVHRWPLGTDWTFYNSDIVDLSQWAGQKVKVGFRYTSTTAEAPTWEIKNLKVVTASATSGVKYIEQDMLDPEDAMAEEYYTIDGRRLTSPENFSGIVIVKRGSHVYKRRL
jgi:endonuclease I